MKFLFCALALTCPLMGAAADNMGTSFAFVQSKKSMHLSDAQVEGLVARYPLKRDHRWLDREFLRRAIAHDALGTDIRRSFLDHTEIEHRFPDDSVVRGLFIDQKSDRLIVIGGGFPVPFEKCAPLLVMFGKADFLVFNYRGVGTSEAEVGWLSPSGLCRKSIKACFKFDPGLTTYGVEEHDDLRALVQGVARIKPHRERIGYASCYSASIFAQAVITTAQSADKPALFSKLIIDGAWPSFDQVIDQCIANPSLLWGAQPPRSPLPCVTHSRLFRWGVKGLVRYGAGLPSNPPVLKELLRRLPAALPVLFLHAQNDCYCSPDEYVEIINAVPGPFYSAQFGCNHARILFTGPREASALMRAFCDGLFGREYFVETIDHKPATAGASELHCPELSCSQPPADTAGAVTAPRVLPPHKTFTVTLPWPIKGAPVVSLGAHPPAHGAGGAFYIGDE